jgi:putative FmdB family regulatory protein
MPVYEYYCPDCSTKFERLASLSRANEQPLCPNCHGSNTRKLLSTFASLRGGAGGDDFGAPSVTPTSGGGCAGCSGGSCSSCH